jgi:leucyl-tRNA synthetase
MLVAVDEAADKIQALALADEKAAKFIEGKKVVKQVYVPGRLVNIVVQG